MGVATRTIYINLHFDVLFNFLQLEMQFHILKPSLCSDDLSIVERCTEEFLPPIMIYHYSNLHLNLVQELYDTLILVSPQIELCTGFLTFLN